MSTRTDPDLALLRGSEQSTSKSLIVVYISYAARYLYLLVLIPFYGRVLGPASYGKVLASMSLFGVVWLACNWGFSVVGTRAVASATTRDQIASEFGTQFHARLLMIPLGLAIGAVGTWLSPLLRAEPLFGAAATAFGLVSAFNLGWYFQGLARYKTSVWLEIAGFAISLTLILALVREPSDGLTVMLVLLGSGLTTLSASYLLAAPGLRGLAVPISGGWHLIKRSSALFASSGVGVLTMNAATYIYSLVATAAAVGLYGAADRVATLCISLMTPANQVMVSRVSNLLAVADTWNNATLLMRRSVLLMTGFGVLVMLVCAALAPFAVPLVFGHAFHPSIVLVQWFSLLFPFAAFNQAARMYVLIPMHYDVVVAKLSMASAAVNWLAMGCLLLGAGGTGLVMARIAGEVVLTMAIAVFMLRSQQFKFLLQNGRLQCEA